MTPRFHSSALALAPLAASLLAGTASAQTAPTQAEVGQRVEKAAAWQQCTGMANNERLACFDDWAREQRELVSAIEDKARSVQASPNAQASGVRAEVAAALASTQPESAPSTTPSGSAGIIGVGLEQGCRDRQFSELSRFWELESGSSCPTFSLRGFQPNTVAIAGSNEVNRQPTSPNPINSATESIDYSKQAMRLHLSLRTKLASGLLTPKDGTLRDSLWAAYSQQSEWQAFNSRLSRPFRNTDHMPELIYVYPTTLQLPGGWLWRYSGVGLAHQSNGQSDPLSRSWNRAYVGAGIEKGNFSIGLRYNHRFREKANDDNPDLTQYIGRSAISMNWLAGAYTSSLTWKTNLKNLDRGSLQFDLTHPVFSDHPNGLRWYLQMFSGYGETLLDYNQRQNRIGVGLSLFQF